MAEVPRGALSPVPLVDQHSYGVLHRELGLGTFETHLGFAAGGTGPAGRSTFYESGPGLALRRWCPPLLGLEPHCSPVHYLARRRELGAYAVSRALLHASGIGCFLVETTGQTGARFPHAPGVPGTPGPDGDVHGLTSPGELASAAGARAREAVCLESLAAQVADTSGSVRSFVVNTAAALHSAARTAAVFTSRAGFEEAGRPDECEVHRAAERWLRARRETRKPVARRNRGAPLGNEPALVRHLLWSALATGRPLQLHIDDAAPLAGFLRSTAGTGAGIVLLARRPHHRAAARLAAAFPHVYADVGPVPAETLAEAPFGKLLFSSGARALPELYVVRARAFREAMSELTAQWVRDGACTPADAARVTGRVAYGNARRLYRLGAGEGEEDFTSGSESGWSESGAGSRAATGAGSTSDSPSVG